MSSWALNTDWEEMLLIKSGVRMRESCMIAVADARSTSGGGMIVQRWVNCKGGLQIFAVYFWHSDGWTARSEALLEAVTVRTSETRRVQGWLLVIPAWSRTPSCKEGGLMKELWSFEFQLQIEYPRWSGSGANVRPFGFMQVMEDYVRLKTASVWEVWGQMQARTAYDQMEKQKSCKRIKDEKEVKLTGEDGEAARKARNYKIVSKEDGMVYWKIWRTFFPNREIWRHGGMQKVERSYTWRDEQSLEQVVSRNWRRSFGEVWSGKRAHER